MHAKITRKREKWQVGPNWFAAGYRAKARSLTYVGVRFICMYICNITSRVTFRYRIIKFRIIKELDNKKESRERAVRVVRVWLVTGQR